MEGVKWGKARGNKARERRRSVDGYRKGRRVV